MEDEGVARAFERRIGGSNIATIIYLLTYCETTTLFDERIDGIFSTEFKGNVYTNIGKAAETLIVASLDNVVASNYMRKVAHFPSSRGLSIVLGITPDAELSDGTVIEIKTKCTRKHLNEPLTPAHALQVITYMAMTNQNKGKVLYYRPEPDLNGLCLLREYGIELSSEDRYWFKNQLIYILTKVMDLEEGELIPQEIRNIATVLYYYRKLLKPEFSSNTKVFIDAWSQELEDLYESAPF